MKTSHRREAHRPAPVALSAEDSQTYSPVPPSTQSPSRSSGRRNLTPPRHSMLRRQHTDTEVEFTYEVQGTPTHQSQRAAGKPSLKPSKSHADVDEFVRAASPPQAQQNGAASPETKATSATTAPSPQTTKLNNSLGKSTSLTVSPEHFLIRGNSEFNITSPPTALHHQQNGHKAVDWSAVRDTFLNERCDRLPQRFAPILLTHTVSHELHSEGQNAWSTHSSIWSKTKRMVGGAFLIGRLHAENLHIWLSVYHFVPLIIVLLAMTVNLLLHVVMGLLFPLIADAFQAQPELLSELSGLRMYAESFLTAWLVFGGGATVGYKLMTVIGDAAIDMCRLVQHPVARVEMGYFVLFTQLRQLWRCGWLGWLCFAFFGIIECVLGAVICFTPYFGIEWSGRDRNVFYVTLVVTGLQATWIAFQAIRLARAPGGLSEEIIAVWWSRKLPRAQRRGVLAVLIAGVAFTIDSGAVYGVTCVAEGLVYLNFVHVFMSVAARLALFTVRMLQSIKVVATDNIARWAAGVFASPLLVLIVINTILVRSPIVSLLQIPPLMLFVDSLCQHTHEHRGQLAKAMRRATRQATTAARLSRHNNLHRRAADDAGRANEHQENRENPQQPFTVATVFWIGMKSIFITQSNNFMREAHYGPRSTLRTLLRLTLAVLILIVIALCTWVSLQFDPQFAGRSKTRCVQLNSTSIRVISDVMEADLYMLDRPPADPNSVVYEEDPHRYDGQRYQGICQRRWAGDLHAADLAYFSAMVYLESESEDFYRMLDFYKRTRVRAADWVLVNRTSAVGMTAGDEEDHHTLDQGISATFHHFRSEALGANVIAIRGTDPKFARDFLQNVLIFSEVALFQIIAFFVPGAGLLPESLVRDLIRIASMIDVAAFDFDVRRERHHYYREVERYINAFIASKTKETANQRRENFIITGHSLGGVVAQIVGARMRYPGVAFSSPGIALMDRKFGIDPDSLDAYITNVVLSNDFLVQVGKLGGSVTHMQCEHRRPEVCHSIDLQTVRLWSTCAAFRQVTAINGSYRILPQWHRRGLESARKAATRTLNLGDEPEEL